MNHPHATPETYAGLIARLQAWNGHDYHRDYELSDAILLADRWTVQEDPNFHGGIRWSWVTPGGNGPTYHTTEQQRPRLLLNSGQAMSVVPYDFTLSLTTTNQQFTIAHVYHRTDIARRWGGQGPTLCVAVLIAALTCKMELGL